MNTLKFSIKTWSAWAPGIHSMNQWKNWMLGLSEIQINDESPLLKQVPAMLRRRLSRLSKMSLQVVYDCVGDNHQLRTVFSSPHGEIQRTKKLLDNIAIGEPISPMGFSLSVHNTASGLYSIASGNSESSIAIAAGEDSLEVAIVEAVSQLHQNDTSPVLIVISDEPLPELYASYNNEKHVPFALALLIDLPDDKNNHLELTITKHSDIDNAGFVEQRGLSLIRFLLNSNQHLSYCGKNRPVWCWKKC